MEKTKFGEVPLEDRLRLLMDNCDEREEKLYMKDLSQEELDGKRETLTTNYIKISDLDDELGKIKADFKFQTDPLKTENKVLLGQVKTRKEEVKGILFHFADQEDSMMYTYDQLGELVGSRRLLPKEKQLKAFPLKVAGAE